MAYDILKIAENVVTFRRDAINEGNEDELNAARSNWRQYSRKTRVYF